VGNQLARKNNAAKAGRRFFREVVDKGALLMRWPPKLGQELAGVKIEFPPVDDAWLCGQELGVGWYQFGFIYRIPYCL